MLTEPEAWREIARRIAEGETPMRHGVCAVMWKLYEASRITLDVMVRMDARASTHAALSPDRWREGEYGGWFAFRMGARKQARILAALWMALEAESDSRSPTSLDPI